MIKINTNTRISTILKAHPSALEAIISISSKFNKLRNPLLRKLMAARTSIAMASKIGGVTADDFFKKLQPLGFEIEKDSKEEAILIQNNLPEFLINISKDKITTLDVRPVINEGHDPFNTIIQAVKKINEGEVLKLINSFEPAPLIPILNKQGFDSFVEVESDEVINTYFFKKDSSNIKEPEKIANSDDWQMVLNKFNNNVVTIDVRHLEMPLPMLTILDELEKLPADKALFVYHKRIPVFLLPELKEKGFEYRANEITDGEVHLLIFKEV